MSKLTAKEIEDYINKCDFYKSVTISKITAYAIEIDSKKSTLRSIPVYGHDFLNNIKEVSDKIVAVPSDGRYGIFFKMPVEGTTFEEFKSGVYKTEYEFYRDVENEEVSNDKIDITYACIYSSIKESYIDFFFKQEQVDYPSEDIDDIAESFTISYENYDYEENYEDEEKN